MRSFIPVLLLAAACTNDYGLGSLNGKVTVPPNPPDLSAVMLEDVMRQRIPEEIDILWVVDNSVSMLAEQEKLAENFPLFMGYYLDSGLDWHIGVVSTDMDDPDHRGRLQGAAGFRFVDPTVPDPVGVFSTMAVLGRDGSRDEMGRAAVEAALTEPRLSGTNSGFYRDEARLSVIIVSDENDHSGSEPTVEDFLTWITTLKEDPEMVTVSAIVTLDVGCGLNEEGSQYRRLVNATGGAEFSICDDNWSPILEQLGVRAAGLEREFYLSEVPVLDTLTVWIEDEGETFSFEIDVDYVYDEIHNSINFVTYTPRATAEIHALYQLAQ